MNGGEDGGDGDDKISCPLVFALATGSPSMAIEFCSALQDLPAVAASFDDSTVSCLCMAVFAAVAISERRQERFDADSNSRCVGLVAL